MGAGSLSDGDGLFVRADHLGNLQCRLNRRSLSIHIQV